jgi:S1-C subfamily serine protease
MGLSETFQAVAPSVVAIAQTLVHSPDGTVPLSPKILATGFIVDPVGIVATNRHVIECFGKLPVHPKTSRPAVAVVLFHYAQTDEGKAYVQLVTLDIKNHIVLESFASAGKWFGQTVPDVGFIQLAVKNVPALPLATQDNYLQVGMPIATAGFPMGEKPLTFLKKLNQMTPFLRRGIVSSVFPFPIPQPHGFTIDVIQQGGSSGSPIFYEDRGEVVGMMAQSLLDFEYVEMSGQVTEHPQNTNISICVTSCSIKGALETFKSQYPPKLDDVRPLAEHLAAIPMETSMAWEVFAGEDIR